MGSVVLKKCHESTCHTFCHGKCASENEECGSLPSKPATWIAACQSPPPTKIWHIRRHISLGLHRLKWPVSLPKFRIVTTLMMVIPSDTIRPHFPLTHWTSGCYFLSESTSYFHHSPRNCKIERSTSVPEHEKPEKSSLLLNKGMCQWKKIKTVQQEIQANGQSQSGSGHEHANDWINSAAHMQ